jgi:hypothetical protein
LEKRRNAAWDERFDHIDNHFNKEGRRIEEWLCVEAKKTKGEVLREIDRFSFDDEDTEGGSPEADQPSPAVGQQGVPEVAVHMTEPTETPDRVNAGSLESRKRVADVEAPAPAPSPKRIKREVFRYCVSSALH